MKIKVGDVVQLKSGGPKMTVSVIGEKYNECMVTCVWFAMSDDYTLQKQDFRPETLEKCGIFSEEKAQS